MTIADFASPQETIETCAEVLRRREAESGGPSDDGPTAEQMERLAQDHLIFQTSPEATAHWFLSFHDLVETIIFSWAFPELDPVEQMLVPYLRALEAATRKSLSEQFPEMADGLQRKISMMPVIRAGKRMDLEAKDRRERIERKQKQVHERWRQRGASFRKLLRPWI